MPLCGGRRRIAHQRAALLSAAETQTVPAEFFLRSFDGNTRVSGEADHLIRESLQPFGINVHKHVEAVGRTLVDPLLQKADNLLRGADEPIMSTTAAGDNLTNGDGSVL